MRVWVDDTFRGVGALRVEVPPGDHALRLEQTGFETTTMAVEVPAGVEIPVPVMQSIRMDLSNHAAALALARFAEVSVPTFSPLTATLHRGSGDGVLVAACLWPAGPVRFEDLESYALQIPTDIDLEGAEVVFRRGPEALGRFPLSPDLTLEVMPFPATVRDALRPGDRIAWAVETRAGAVAKAEFAVVPADARLVADLARIDRDLAVQPEPFRAFTRAARLLADGLALGALREIRPAAGLSDVRPLAQSALSARAPVAEEFLPLGIVREALRLLLPDVPEGSVELVSLVENRFARVPVPADQKAAWFGE